MTMNGISLMTVMPHPLKRSIHSPLNDLMVRRTTCRRASQELGNCDAYARYFTTSVGALTTHAAISPSDEATMWSTAAPPPPSTDFVDSYEAKKRTGAGTEPAITNPAITNPTPL